MPLRIYKEYVGKWQDMGLQWNTGPDPIYIPPFYIYIHIHTHTHTHIHTPPFKRLYATTEVIHPIRNGKLLKVLIKENNMIDLCDFKT